jgi:hypothetical protein
MCSNIMSEVKNVQQDHYQSVRYVKLCHAVGVVAVGKLDKLYQSLRVHLCLRIDLSIV